MSDIENAWLVYYALVLIIVYPILVGLYIVLMKIIDKDTVFFILIAYYILVIPIGIYFLRRREKKIWKERREMQNSTDKFYREYFRKNKKN